MSVVAGRLADWLQAACGWSSLRVRCAAQAASFTGTAVALLPLALGGAALPTAAAVASLTVSVALQGLNFSGFHSHVQDIAPQQAGVILGVTNSCGVLGGIGANLLAGQLVGSGPNGFAVMFGLTAALSAVGAAAWLAFTRGEPLRLPAY